MNQVLAVSGPPSFTATPLSACFDGHAGFLIGAGISDFPTSAYSGHRPQFNTGPMTLNSKNTFANITDGSSNSILIGEQAMVGLTENLPGACWVWSSSGRSSGGLCVVFNASAVLCGMNRPLIDFSWPDVVSREGEASGHSGMQLGFSSFHAGGGHIALCDGSVRFLSENTDLLTQQRLGCMSDGNTVGDY